MLSAPLPADIATAPVMDPSVHMASPNAMPPNAALSPTCPLSPCSILMSPRTPRSPAAQTPMAYSPCTSPITPLRLSSIKCSPDLDLEMPTPVTCKLVEREGNRFYRAGAVSMNGFRSNMEDAHAMKCKDTKGVFGVFDGHAGNVCSFYFAKHFPEKAFELGIPMATSELENLFMETDAQFRKTHTLGGSTGAVLLTTASGPGKFQVQIGNVGDSRVLICKPNGTIKFVTEDHKPSIPSEQERITRHGGQVRNDRVDGRLAMSRALGDNEFKIGSSDLRDLKVTALPDCHLMECDESDFIVIACDGIFEGMTNEQVAHFCAAQIQKTADCGKAAAKLVDEALRFGSGDNMTAMIVQFTDGTTFKSRREFVPGPYTPQNGSNFRRAYHDTIAKAGLTLDEALETRFRSLCAQLHSEMKNNIGGQIEHAVSDLVAEMREMKSDKALGITNLHQAVLDRIQAERTPELVHRVNTVVSTSVPPSWKAHESTGPAPNCQMPPQMGAPMPQMGQMGPGMGPMPAQMPPQQMPQQQMPQQQMPQQQMPQQQMPQQQMPQQQMPQQAPQQQMQQPMQQMQAPVQQQAVSQGGTRINPAVQAPPAQQQQVPQGGTRINPAVAPNSGATRVHPQHQQLVGRGILPMGGMGMGNGMGRGGYHGMGGMRRPF